MGFKVGDSFRNSPLSKKPGGVTVCVKELNGSVYEYDKIKYPYAYMRKVERENPGFECWIKEECYDA